MNSSDRDTAGMLKEARRSINIGFFFSGVIAIGCFLFGRYGKIENMGIHLPILADILCILIITLILTVFVEPFLHRAYRAIKNMESYAKSGRDEATDTISRDTEIRYRTRINAILDKLKRDVVSMPIAGDDASTTYKVNVLEAIDRLKKSPAV